MDEVNFTCHAEFRRQLRYMVRAPHLVYIPFRKSQVCKAVAITVEACNTIHSVLILRVMF